MPKRTNAFQRMVLHLKTALADGAEVEESAMVPERVSGNLREVDILVTCTLAGHDLRIAFECADQGRPMDVTWVEGQCAKHDALPTDKLVLVSASGVTSTAHTKAKDWGAELMVVEDADGWGPGAAREVVQMVASRVNLTVERCSLTVLVPDESECKVPGLPDLRVCTESGETAGELAEFVYGLLRHHAGLVQTLLQTGRKHPKARYFELSVRPTTTPSPTLLEAWDVPTGADDPALPIGGYLLSEPQNVLHPIVDLHVVGRYQYAEAPADMRFGVLDGFRVAWGEAQYGEERVLLSHIDQQGQR